VLLTLLTKTKRSVLKTRIVYYNTPSGLIENLKN